MGFSALLGELALQGVEVWHVDVQQVVSSLSMPLFECCKKSCQSIALRLIDSTFYCGLL